MSKENNNKTGINNPIPKFLEQFLIDLQSKEECQEILDYITGNETEIIGELFNIVYSTLIKHIQIEDEEEDLLGDQL